MVVRRCVRAVVPILLLRLSSLAQLVELSLLIGRQGLAGTALLVIELALTSRDAQNIIKGSADPLRAILLHGSGLMHDIHSHRGRRIHADEACQTLTGLNVDNRSSFLADFAESLCLEHQFPAQRSIHQFIFDHPGRAPSWSGLTQQPEVGERTQTLQHRARLGSASRGERCPLFPQHPA
jgi:hypothetical protein